MCRQFLVLLNAHINSYEELFITNLRSKFNTDENIKYIVIIFLFLIYFLLLEWQHMMFEAQYNIYNTASSA